MSPGKPFSRRGAAQLIGALCWLVAIGLVPTGAAAQGDGATRLVRLSQPILFDGVVDDPAWSGIEPLPLTMYTPVFRGQPTEATEIRLAYDDDYLYASGRFFDSDPDGIRTNSLYRDRWSGDDTFVIFVDSFNDNQSTRRFAINPAGNRMDELLGADGAEFNSSWDTYWDAATSRDERGWYFEMRIPFSSLPFQVSSDEVVMGITASRLIARKNERLTFPAIDPRFRFNQPSVAHDFIISGVSSSRPAYLTPYVLSGLDRSWSGGAPVGFATSQVGELGGDLRYSLTDNMSLDLSVNTDFAQVEADDEQINLTRFPIFFPEKRQFFQERSDIFLFNFGEGGRLFHSRQIGLSPDRNPVRILGGARVSGRVGDWDIGALSMQSGSYGDNSGENFGVARVKRRILNPYSHAGAIVTSRVGTDGRSSVATGVDATVRTLGDHYVTFKWAGTRRDSQPATLVDASQFYFEWARRADRGLRYWFRIDRVGADYHPDLGFIPRGDFTHNSLYAVYSATGGAGSVFRSFGPGAILNTFFGNDGMELESLYAAHWWEYELRNGANGWLQVTHRVEDVKAAFELGDGVFVPAGEHRFTDLWFNFRSGPGSLLRTQVDVRAGAFYHGRQVQIEAGPTWNVSPFLEIAGTYRVNFLRFPDTGESLDIHLVRLRLRAATSPRLSLAALAQYNSLSDRVGLNLRLRYNFREGTDFWLVYDEGLNSDRTPDDAIERLPLSDTRAVRVKLSYALTI